MQKKRLTPKQKAWSQTLKRIMAQAKRVKKQHPGWSWQKCVKMAHSFRYA